MTFSGLPPSSSGLALTEQASIALCSTWFWCSWSSKKILVHLVTANLPNSHQNFHVIVLKYGHFSFILYTWTSHTHTDRITAKIITRHVEMLETHNAGNIIFHSVQAVSYLLHLPVRWFPSSHSDDALSMSDSSWLFTSLLDLCNINVTGSRHVALIMSNLDIMVHAAHNGKIRHAFLSNYLNEKRNCRWQNIPKMDLAEQGFNVWTGFKWLRII